MKISYTIARENSRSHADNLLCMLASSKNCRTFHKKFEKYCGSIGKNAGDVVFDMACAHCMFTFELSDREVELGLSEDFPLSDKEIGTYVLWTTALKDVDYFRPWKGFPIKGYNTKEVISKIYSLYRGILQTETALDEQKVRKKRTVYRYMSENEFEKLMAGDVLVNNTDHSRFRHTHSVGFCFLPSPVVAEYNGEKLKFSPEEAFSMLGRVVSEDVLVRFETEEVFRFSYGQYALPFGGGGDFFNPELIYLRELSLTDYSKNTLRPVAFCKGEPRYTGHGAFYSGKWETVNP